MKSDKYPSRQTLKAQLAGSTEKRLTLSFYRYAHIVNPEAFRQQLIQIWEPWQVYGRVYVATEGINAQISLPERHFEAFKSALYKIDFLAGVRLNIAVDDDGKSFYKLKIKIRPKIVADGLDDRSFDVTQRGEHLDAAAFNQLTSQPDTVLVDMRNHYEWEVGHFEGAILPDVDTFRDALPKVEAMLQDHKDKPIVMYCTGGIRCEKASAYLKHKGFQDVYQLDGGIIQYAHEVKSQALPNKFHGKNFVFDERLGERITEEIISQCHQCGAPCDTHVNCRNVSCNLLFIQCEACAVQKEGCCSDDCQDFIHLPEAEQKVRRKGYDSEVRIFTKSRMRKK